MPLLEIRGLWAAYGPVPVLHGIELDVAEGELVGILGHNGMGKTTLLRAIMGFVHVSGGSIRFGGREIGRLPTWRRARLGMALVPQGREIFPNLTVLQNMLVGIPRGEAPDAVIREVLGYFPRLNALLDRRGGALSGGEQQLLALARCLCARPSTILLDEPTEGIQPSIVQEIAAVMGELRARRKLTVVLVEQNLDFIAALAERVLILQKGEITRQVDSRDLENAEIMSAYTGFGAPAG